MNTVWVCGRFVAETDAGVVWELQGVFTDRERAVAACRDESYFIGPVRLNEALPHETLDWPGVEWPLAAVRE